MINILSYMNFFVPDVAGGGAGRGRFGSNAPADLLQEQVALVKRRRPIWKMHGVARVDGHMSAEAELSLTETLRRPL